MFKLLLVLSALAFAVAAPGVVVAPVAPVHGHAVVAHAPVIHHHGAHAVHSHVIHHPAPVKAVVAHPVVVAKPVVPVVVKPVVPVVPVHGVHHAHSAVVAHH
ncbi:uncharacterized protein [Musca autumnalis]|uniref:uncharacterized protein n=1 Tax=Musca autumnalis TaxID=221902 RepID=UPI003CF37998